MNVQLNTVSESRKNLVVTLDKSEVDTEHKAVLGEYVRLARLPGFRPGKAPEALVVKRFAKEIAEVNSSIGQISSASTQVQTSALELSQLAEQLSQMVSKFKV